MTGLAPVAGLLAATATALALAPRGSGQSRTLAAPAGADPRPAPSPPRVHVIPVVIPVVVLAGGAALLVAPPLGVALLAAPWIRGRVRYARAMHAGHRAVVRALPDVVDLLLLCTSAGTSLALAHPMVARRAPAPLDEPLLRAAAAAEAGAPRADALLDALRPQGDGAMHLGHVLADHLRYGVALGPGLERLGGELRLERQRRAEQEARRVPVRLLAPLLICVLPAFALLTVAPLLAASLRTLPT